MKSIKNLLSSLYGKLALIFSVIFGILIYILNKKNREIRTLKTKARLVKTEKEADSLKNDIKKLSENRKKIKGEQEHLDEALKILEEKKKQLKNETKSSKDIENFWNKND
jgi:uncharacterized protein HemX